MVIPEGQETPFRPIRSIRWAPCGIAGGSARRNRTHPQGESRLLWFHNPHRSALLKFCLT